MSRRKRYIRGRVYLINDHTLVKHSKSNRRIVVLNNNKDEMHVRRITSLFDKAGNIKSNVIEIEIYPEINKRSGVEMKTFRKTLKGKPIREKYLKKTKTRLNKWDIEKIYKTK